MSKQNTGRLSEMSKQNRGMPKEMSEQRRPMRDHGGSGGFVGSITSFTTDVLAQAKTVTSTISEETGHLVETVRERTASFVPGAGLGAVPKDVVHEASAEARSARQAERNRMEAERYFSDRAAPQSGLQLGAGTGAQSTLPAASGTGSESLRAAPRGQQRGGSPPRYSFER